MGGWVGAQASGANCRQGRGRRGGEGGQTVKGQQGLRVRGGGEAEAVGGGLQPEGWYMCMWGQCVCV